MDLIIDNITKKIGKKTILNSVNMKLDTGKCIGLVGPNGAGKTTLIRSILGLYESDSGTILYNNKLLKDIDILADESRMSFLLDTTGLMRLLTVRENIEFFYRNYNEHINIKKMNLKINEILEQIELTEYSNSNIRELSRGMRQRLAIGRTMVSEPQLFIMDEPYLGLDVEAQFFLSNYINQLKQKKCSILISAHDLGHLEKICDSIYFVKKGHIVTNELIPPNCERDYLEKLYKNYIGGVK